MKPNKLYITISSLIGTTALTVALLAVSVGACASGSSADKLPATPFTPVINPETPAQVTFCGQNIDLTRTDMWERFDRELTSIIYTHGNTLLTIKRANKYFPVMRPILKANGVPEDLVYLACVESYLSPRAYSPAKAAGIWQFLKATAEQYGLEVNDEVDERYNLEKATAAAARMLRNSHKRFGNWESAMAAYNGGPQRIATELEAQCAKSAFDLYLTEETSRYTFRIMAMKTVLENPAKYGFNIHKNQLYKPEDFEVVEVNGPVADWPKWAIDHGISYMQLREANPWIRAKKLTNKYGKTYQVHIPTPQSLKR